MRLVRERLQRRYHRAMKLAMPFQPVTETSVKLPAHLQVELEDALADADREEGISADELFAQIKERY